MDNKLAFKDFVKGGEVLEEKKKKKKSKKKRGGGIADSWYTSGGIPVGSGGMDTISILSWSLVHRLPVFAAS